MCAIRKTLEYGGYRNPENRLGHCNTRRNGRYDSHGKSKKDFVKDLKL